LASLTSTRRRPIASLAALAALLGAAAAGAAPAGSVASPEYVVKAAFLYRFAQFVEWPSSAFDGPEAPLRFCVFGRDPFGEALDRTTSGESISGRGIDIRRTMSIAGLEDCHLVFVGHSERAHVAAVIERVQHRPVLTVGETQGFAERGGVINFVLEQNRVRFEVNPESARREGLTIASGLLRLARLVGTGDAPPEGRSFP
jgi:hypothetical protein